MEDKLSHMESKKINEENDLGFVDLFKANNYILSIVSKANGIIGRVVRNFNSRETNVVLKIYKILKRSLSEYCTQLWVPVLRHRNWIVWFDGISTIVGYLMPNPFCTYIFDI